MTGLVKFYQNGSFWYLRKVRTHSINLFKIFNLIIKFLFISVEVSKIEVEQNQIFSEFSSDSKFQFKPIRNCFKTHQNLVAIQYSNLNLKSISNCFKTHRGFIFKTNIILFILYSIMFCNLI